MTICPPESTYLRLPVVSELTGTPESTLRDAILTGDLRGMKVARAWHTRLEDYNEWIETTGTRGGDVRTAPKRPLAGDSQAGRAEDRGTSQADQGRSTGSAQPKAGRPKKGKAKHKPVVWECVQPVDRTDDPPSANHAGHLQILDGLTGEGPVG